MSRSRLEAFSDGVIAILITIMVLELKIPAGSGLPELRHEVLPAFLTYLLSFVFLGIYWNNHHHMFHLVDRINGTILWANLHLLFWLSLVPSVTGWMGEEHFGALPTAIYGMVFLLSAVAWLILQRAIVTSQGRASKLAAALGRDVKGKVSATLYASGVAIAFVYPAVSQLLYVLVALMWLVPDRRFERVRPD